MPQNQYRKGNQSIWEIHNFRNLSISSINAEGLKTKCIQISTFYQAANKEKLG